MPPIAPALIALFVALAIGVPATAYLLTIHRKRLTASAGVHALAAMRWREFSQFVIAALQAQGFEAAPLGDGGTSGEPADLLLKRDNRSWLLACRQSPDYRVTDKQVEEMQRAVRMRGAAGGVIATLGRVVVSAGTARERIELVDGRSLWELIGPMLPAGLHEHIGEQAQRRERGALLVLWAVAFAAGFAVAIGADRLREERAAAPAGSAVAPAVDPAIAAATDATPAAPPSATTDETAARQRVLDDVSAVSGVDRAVWSSRSTLLVLLESESVDPRPAICAALERHDALRASRIQLQPPSGSRAPVRFAQCWLY
jgi:restriction system protein